MSKVRHLEIPKPSGRRLAISDIHGCSKTFEALLEQLSLTDDDHLYVLGDMINRGPSSASVLNRIIQLKLEGRQVYLLRGNHEQMVIKALSKSPMKLHKVLKSSNSSDLLVDGSIPPKYQQVLKETYHYFSLDDYYLVHAGFDFSKKLPFENTHAMLHMKEFKAKKSFLNGKRVVLGHSPQTLSTIMKKIKKGKRKLYIDNGCVNAKIKGQGNLICLNLDSLALSIQKNIDA